MLYVIAKIEVVPGKRTEVLKHFAWLVPQVRAEEGCIEYTAAVDIPTTIPVQVEPRQDIIVVIEKWESVQKLEAHLTASHMMEYRKRVTELVKGVSLEILDPV